MRQHGADVHVLIATSAASLEHAASEALPRHEGLVVVGGDGMAHLGLNLVAGTDVVLGLVPAGTGNDFARHLGLPRDSVRRAVDTVLFGTTRTVDLGRVGDRRFGCVLSTGLDAAVNARANRLRRPTGRSRYHVALLAELGAFDPISVVVEVDGVGYEHRAMLVAVGNGSSYGGGMRICPAADTTDGLLDITIVDELSVASLLRLFPQVYSGRHVEHPKAHVYRGRTVSISAPTADEPPPAFADGEQVGVLPVTVTAEPAALRVRAPRLP